MADRIREAYAELASTAPTEAAAAGFIADGERENARIATAVRLAFAEATSRIYWMTALLVLIGCALVLRIPELPLRTTHDRAHAAAQSRQGDPVG